MRDLDALFDLAVDGMGDLYFVGTAEEGSTLPTDGGGPFGEEDAYVFKLDATGSDRLWSFYLGGSRGDFGYGIAVDSKGSAYVVGSTASVYDPDSGNNFPISAGAYGGPVSTQGAFISKVKADGSGLEWSTVVGGSWVGAAGFDIVIAEGNSEATTRVFILGTLTPAYDPTTVLPGGSEWSPLDDWGDHWGFELFVIKLDPGKSGDEQIGWTTFLDDADRDWTPWRPGVGSLGVDGNGDVYVTAQTRSLKLPSVVEKTGSTLYELHRGLVFKGGTIWTGQGEYYGTEWNHTGPYFEDFGDFGRGSLNRPDTFVAKLDSNDGDIRWSTYLGGRQEDQGVSIAVDGNGSAVVMGTTGRVVQGEQSLSNDFPTTADAFDRTFGPPQDTFVVRLRPDGSTDWSTYLGGSRVPGGDFASGMVADAAGNVYLVGMAGTSDFPTTTGAKIGGSADVFVAKVSGDELVWSTYLGGSNSERDANLALDAAGNLYVTGFTNSADFPTTAGAWDPVLDGGGYGDAFVTKIDAANGRLLWSTYLGGSNYDSGFSMAADATGVYVGGTTWSEDFPIVGGRSALREGIFKSFVSKLDSQGSSILWSTSLGAPDEDHEKVLGMVLDRKGNLYATGEMRDRAFVAKLDAEKGSLAALTFLGGDAGTDVAPDGEGDVVVLGIANSDLFVAKLDGNTLELLRSTSLGGSGGEGPGGLAVDGRGNLWVGGTTSSSDFPVTPGALESPMRGGVQGFLVELDSSDSTIRWSSLLGREGGDSVGSVAVDSAGDVFVTGRTSSEDLPPLGDSTHSVFGGPFVMKLSFGAAAAPPSVDAVFDGLAADIDFQTSTSAISANWSGSAGADYEWAIGTTPGGTEVQPFAALGQVNEATNSSLALRSGATYYVSVRATNTAGVGGIVTSDGVTVDDTLPTPAQVNDGLTPPDIDLQGSTTTLSANWAPFVDEGSGVVGYGWAIGTAPGAADVQPFVAVGLSLSATNSGLALARDTPYYVTVRATDAVGWTQTASSDGVSVAYLLVERLSPCGVALRLRLTVGGSDDLEIDSLRFTGAEDAKTVLDVDRDGLYDPEVDFPLGSPRLRLLIPAHESRDVLAVSPVHGSLASPADVAARLRDSGEPIAAVGEFPFAGECGVVSPQVQEGAFVIRNRPLPTPEPVLPYATEVQLLAFDVRVEGDPVVLQRLRVHTGGTGYGRTDVRRATLWRDERAVSVIEQPGGFLVFELAETIAPGSVEVWKVTFDFAGWSSAGRDFQLVFDVGTGRPIKASVEPAGEVVIGPWTQVREHDGSEGAEGGGQCGLVGFEAILLLGLLAMRRRREEIQTPNSQIPRNSQLPNPNGGSNEVTP